MRDVIAVLERAIELLNKGWCQRAFAKDIHNRFLLANDPSACEWCLEGSVMKAAVELDLPYAFAINPLVARLPGGIPQVFVWNDAPGRTKEEVIAFVQDVIQKLKEKEAAHV